MDPKVQWTEIALTELHEVAEYIARDSGARAAELIREARASARSIATLPEASPMVQEFDDPTIRETYVKRRYRLIYQLAGNKIWIIAFIDSARDLPSLWDWEERDARTDD
jgi:toxin ParE1/3/4